LKADKTAGQLPLKLPFIASQSLDDFFVSESNKEAVEWLNRFPDWPSSGLVLCGESGSGKTHLAKVFAASTGCAVEEDIDMNCDDSRQRAVFHLFNSVKERGGHILLTARSMQDIQRAVTLPDLKSRIMACTPVELGLPDDELLAAVLVKQLADRQIIIDGDALKYAIRRVRRSFAAVRDLADKADSLAMALGRRITVPVIRQALGAEQDAGD